MIGEDPLSFPVRHDHGRRQAGKGFRVFGDQGRDHQLVQRARIQGPAADQISADRGVNGQEFGSRQGVGAALGHQRRDPHAVLAPPFHPGTQQDVQGLAGQADLRGDGGGGQGKATVEPEAGHGEAIEQDLGVIGQLAHQAGVDGRPFGFDVVGRRTQAQSVVQVRRRPPPALEALDARGHELGLSTAAIEVRGCGPELGGAAFTCDIGGHVRFGEVWRFAHRITARGELLSQGRRGRIVGRYHHTAVGQLCCVRQTAQRHGRARVEARGQVVENEPAKIRIERQALDPAQPVGDPVRRGLGVELDHPPATIAAGRQLQGQARLAKAAGPCQPEDARGGQAPRQVLDQVRPLDHQVLDGQLARIDGAVVGFDGRRLARAPLREGCVGDPRGAGQLEQFMELAPGHGALAVLRGQAHQMQHDPGSGVAAVAGRKAKARPDIDQGFGDNGVQRVQARLAAGEADRL